MPVVVDWNHLVLAAVPLLASLSIAIGVGLGLRYWTQQNTFPRARERCVDCAFEGDLIQNETCQLECAVNSVPLLPLVVFIASTTLVLLAGVWPWVLESFVYPITSGRSGLSSTVNFFVLATSLASAVASAAYFVQDAPRFRDPYLVGGSATAVAGLLVTFVSVGPWSGVGAGLAGLGLGWTLLGAALEHRARQGRPMLGLRAIGAATTPMFVVTFLAVYRLVQLLVYGIY